MKHCSVPNCTDKYYALELCEKHYKRQRKGNSLTEKSVYQMSDLEKLAEKYTVSSNGCWEWKKPRPDGRANTFLYQGKVQIAYRAAWKIYNGPIPDNLCVLHHCDNGLCVNPNHLFLGTHKDNYEDMRLKGRSNTAKGESKKSSKLTEKDIIEIKTSLLSRKELTLKFGVNRQTIADVLEGKTWKHVSIPS